MNKSVVHFVWHYIRPYKWFYVLMLIPTIINSFYAFIYNYALKLFIDIMCRNDSTTFGQVIYPISLFLILQIGTKIIWRFSKIFEVKTHPYVKKAMLIDAYDYVQSHPYTFFQNNHAGAVTSKVKGIVDGYDKLWREAHVGLMAKGFKVLVTLIALSFLNLYLGVFLVIWVIGFMVFMTPLYKKLREKAYQETSSFHQIIGNIADRITNFQTIFSFAAQNHELNVLKKNTMQNYMPKQVATITYDLYVQIIGSIFYITLFFVVLFLTVQLKNTGLISVGDFAFIFGLTYVLTEDVHRTTLTLQDFSRILGDFKSSLSILQIPHTQKDKSSAKPLSIKQPEIIFENVYFAYEEDQPIFSNLSLNIQPGEKVGIVGASGEGKSSLANILMGYFPISKGRITIDGQDIADVTQSSLRQNISLIPQDTILFHRSILDNVRYGNLKASDEEISQACKAAHIHEYITSLPQGYKTVVGERGIKLSGGQRQRIAIARAILKSAPILILDEATSSLDSFTEKEIQKSLSHLLNKKNQTVIAIAHRLSTLEGMDRIIVMHKGKIAEEGRHSDLAKKSKGVYAKLWKHQNSLYS